MNKLGKNFWSLNVAVAGGAFNDNFFKITLIILISFKAPADQQTLLISLAGAFLVLPFLIFSPFAGWLADRYSKSKVSQVIRTLEPILIIAGSYFLFTSHIWGLMAVLFLFGLQSALFSPSKYGLIPELVSEANLTKANGYVELATFVGILFGTGLAGQLQGIGSAANALTCIILLAVSGVAIYAIYQLAPTKVRNPQAKFELNPVRSFKHSLKAIRADNDLFLVLLASAWFWFVGALFQLSIFIYAKEYLFASEYQTGLLITALTLGIGGGSLLAGKLSHSRLELGMVPIASLGMAICSLIIGTFTLSMNWAYLLFTILGVFAGLYIVPLNAYFQAKSPVDHRGEYLAAANIIFNIFILCSSLVLWLVHGLFGLSITFLYIMLGIASIYLTYLGFKKMPKLVLRCFNFLLTNTFYRLDVEGSENLPEQGGALLVSNHVSYVDALLLSAASTRPVRFIMIENLYKLPVVNFVCRHMDVIPIWPKAGGEEVARVLAEAQAAVLAGEIVCIFAEGRITRDGELNEFKTGLETIMKGVDAPIVPVYLGDVWGSIFSFEGGDVFWKIPSKVPYPVEITFGEAMSADSTAREVEKAVVALSDE